ncbi:MAG: YbgC/FadM family acyl-CoA thioesterase [Actinobacteria bacterium]|nr:YbgC/FadM family acyl-CoA thioesterase [Actinomycetota bacterium]MSX34642.1 YbgC/FadM family acyl-CoA thioesterase [Actinomycetota bacterium]MSX95461.1 YbgC/FadM family acyl-CoA thioesterase [Actinomycetota bacterium]MSY25058.1 YbgC/FadM family acyl-CoA thioesterase [Actinomycetota bacterium]MSY33642.1 YbgC/FadM family acyl-CoA thioesterase [Actinomycetota bacterium]
MRVSLDIPTNASSYPFSHEVRVRFAETDAMGVAHHSSYIAWLEVARVEFLRSLGTPYPDIRAQGVDLAVLELFMNYRVSARFDDLITVHTRVANLKGATFQMDYLLRVEDQISALGTTVHGVVDPEGRASRMPSWLRELLAGA